MARHVLPIVVLLGACRPDGLAVRVPRLEAPPVVTMTDVRYGEATFLPVPIENSGTGRATARASVTAPFRLPDTAVELDAGDVTTLQVALEPSGYEAVQGTLTLTTDVQTLEIALEATVDVDGDDDGYLSQGAGGDDCDDTRADVHPTGLETCDDADNDCDGIVDLDASDPPIWYVDADGDGYGDATAPLATCDPPSDTAASAGDCNDGNATVHPGATEVWYDGTDQDCSGGSDYDRDGDGFENLGSGGSDCIDTDPGVHPGATETWYDGVDQDCSGGSDYDQDRDGELAPVGGGADCVDTDARIAPELDEVDDGLDQDCDGWVDEDFLARGDLLVTEILRDPKATANADGQFVEIANASDRAVDLANLTLATSVGTVTLPAASLAPGEAAVICVKLDSLQNGGLACTARLPGLLLVSDHAEIALDFVIDEVDWTGWTATEGVSWELKASAFDPDANDAKQVWCTAATTFGDGDRGTPGDSDASCD